MLRIDGLRYSYGERVALDLRRFEAAAGEHWLVLGASGSGKSTLLALVAGLLRAQAGSIEVGSQALADLGPAALDRWRGRTVGIVPQRLHLVGSLTVRDNLLLASYLAGLPEDAARAGELLASLGIGDRARAFPAQLSYGQQQRVALARALMNRPKLLLADEPTSNLDDRACAAALDLLQVQARDNGATLLVATHDARARSRFERRLELAA